MALARLRSAVNVPPRDTGDPDNERVELVELTVIEELSSSVFPIVWPRLVRQVPLDATHPAVTLIPFPVNVEVADELFNIEPPEIVNPFDEDKPPVEIPPVKVEVAVEVALIEATYGVVVETTLPELLVARRVERLTLDS